MNQVLEVTVPAIHEVATLTSKGQITLPKSIRQALGAETGSKLAFEYEGGRVVVRRVSNEPHTDPAIASFLALLEQDIQTGKNLTTLPGELTRAMLVGAAKPVDLDEEIEGDVSL